MSEFMDILRLEASRFIESTQETVELVLEEVGEVGDKFRKGIDGFKDGWKS